MRFSCHNRLCTAELAPEWLQHGPALLFRNPQWKTLIPGVILQLTLLLLQHRERLEQLVFGTLHHAQPGFAFILKRSEVKAMWVG